MRTTTRHRNTLGMLLAIGAALTALGEVTGTGPLMLGGGDAHAVIGRPMTPVSYAGVARRTTRRTVYAGAATQAYATPVVATTAVVTTLPAGCARVVVNGVATYQCGAVRYQPYYHGTTVVYQQI